MNGWRGRIGIIIPSANINMEPEFYRMAPEGVSTHASRMMLSALTVEGLLEMTKQAERAALELKSAAVDLLVYGCTSGGFIKGLEHDREVMAELEEKTSIPTITTVTAVLEVFKLLGVKKISVASPYGDEINTKLRNVLEENRFEVVALQGLGLGERKAVFPLSDLEISSLGIQAPHVAYRLVKQAQKAGPEADAYFIPCTNFRTAEIISQLEDDIGKPVISANQATLAVALRRLGIKKAVQGYGSVFDL